MLALLLGATFGLHRIVELDLFQQIAVGRSILSDPGSIGIAHYHHTVDDGPYPADKWLASVVAAGVDATGGEHGLMLYQILLGAAAAVGALALFRACGARAPAAAASVAVALLCWAYRLEPRPDTISLVLTAVVAAMLRSRIPFSRLRWLVPVVFVLWVNLHGYFVVGLLILIAETVGAACGDAGGALRAGETGRRGAVRRGAALLGLALMACLVHPQGVQALLWPVRQLLALRDHPVLRLTVQEFQPSIRLLQGLGPAHAVWVALTVIAATALACVRPWRRVEARVIVGGVLAIVWLVWPPIGLTSIPYRVTWALLMAAVVELPASFRARSFAMPLVVIGFTALAVPMVRNVSLIPLGALAILAPSWSRAVARHRRVAWGIALTIVLAVGWARLADRIPAGSYRCPAWTGWGIDRRSLAVGAVDFFQRHGLEGPILNHFDNGGFLLYRLHPAERVFVSGNTSMYPPEFLERFQHDVVGPAARLDLVVARHGVRTAIVDHGAAETTLLAWRLLAHPEWKLVHLDQAASVFSRSQTRVSIDLDEAVSAVAAARLPDRSPLPGLLAPRDRLHPALNLAHFLRSVGRPDLAVAEARSLAGNEPPVELALFLAAAADEAGSLPLVAPDLEEAHRRHPADAGVRSWLARAVYLRGVESLVRGDTNEARGDLERSRTLAPDAPGPWIALARERLLAGDRPAADRLVREGVSRAGPELRQTLEADPVLGSFTLEPDRPEDAD